MPEEIQALSETTTAKNGDEVTGVRHPAIFANKMSE
jgi:hypothetical protein